MFKTKILALAVAAFATLGTASTAATLSVMNGDHDVIDQGRSQPNLAEYGHTATLFTDSTTGHADAIAAGNPIILEERSVDAATVSDYASFISGGGRVILLGSYATSGETFFNGIFGSSIDFADTDGGCCGGAPFGITAAAAGTTFEGGPASLGEPSSTHRVLSGLPAGAEVFYENGAGEAGIFRMTLGAGDLFYMNWDYCCGSSTQERAYYDVLDSAITFESVAAVPLPAAGWMLLAAIGGLGAASRRRRHASTA